MLIQLLEANDYSQVAIRTYQQLGEVIKGKCHRDQISLINILVVRLAHLLDASFLAPYSTLTTIASPTTGLNHIDMEYCQNRNIRIFSLQEHQDAIDKVTSTSELTFALMLSLLRHIPKANSHVVMEHEWQRDAFKSRQLSSLTLGLIGLGRIGGHMATYARAFGMQVLAYDPYVGNKCFSELGITKVELASLCQQADIISIHANQRDDNHHLIGAEEICIMKNDALLINTARGSLLDEAAAAQALRAQKLGGIACDVLEQETRPRFLQTSPLLEAASEGLNVILTPHIGGCTTDAMHMTEAILADAVYKELGSAHG